MNIEITIVNKRIINTTDKAIVFSTKTRSGNVFSIPFSQIKSKNETKIVISDTYHEDASVYEIPAWLFVKIKEYLDEMSEFDVLIPNF